MQTQQFDSTRPDFSPYGFTCELWTPVLMPKPDRHNEIEINLLCTGSLTYLFGGQRTTILPGHLGMFWAAIPHQIVACEGSTPYHVVTLPLGWFLAAGLPEPFTQAILNGTILHSPVSAASEEAAFSRWETDLLAKNPVRERAALLEIHARLLRLSQSLPANIPRVSDPDLSKADQLACYIARHYLRPVSALEIAEASGLHPNYAMSLFRRAFGTTMTQFVVQHRISHAQRLLVTTDERVIDVAFESGFQSLSRFNEAFKKLCGRSPREFRMEHLVGLRYGGRDADPSFAGSGGSSAGHERSTARVGMHRSL